MHLRDIKIHVHNLRKVWIYADRCHIVELRILLLKVIDPLGEVSHSLLIVGRIERGQVDTAQAELQHIHIVVSLEVFRNYLLHFSLDLLIIEVDIIFTQCLKIFIHIPIYIL